MEKEAPKRACCVLDIKDEHQEAFYKKYNHKHWVTQHGEILPERCYLLRVDFSGMSRRDATNDDYKTRQELSALSLEPGHPLDLFEFQPPPMMPQGNVGTTTRHFQELIRSCQLPGSLIKKLRLGNPKGRRKRRFGKVPLNYGTSVSASEEDTQTQGGENIAFTASGHLIPSSADFEEERKKWRRKRNGKGMPAEGPRMELEKEAEDGAEVEEWERYEPFHEDVTSQDRIKERRFEKELEVTWDKGSSGLVFYTDEQYWRALEGDFDEQTTDEWDVDMSVYYEEGGGDKDARDGLDMMTSNQLRAGSLQQSVFKSKKEKGEDSAQAAKKSKKKNKRARDEVDTTTSNQQSVVKKKEEEGNGSAQAAKRTKGERKIGPTPPPAIGSFEAHTKGFGRRLMEAMGWKEGTGLGAGSAGIPYALENDGQHPRDRKGFGYHGEKLQAWNSSASASTRKPQPRQHSISTVFDRPEEADPAPHHLRAAEPTKLTHRPSLMGPAPHQLRTAEPTKLIHQPPLIDQAPHHLLRTAEPTKLTHQPPLIDLAPHHLLRTAKPTKLTHQPPLIDLEPHHHRTAEPTKLTHRPPLIDLEPHHLRTAEPTKLTHHPPLIDLEPHNHEAAEPTKLNDRPHLSDPQSSHSAH
ncbi:G patch domain-containing protein 3-like isoform X3 [Eriocheir sinensis]|nr:G patch domain-containing protein 3-like isoform X3 [Eriocheir sinensis]